MADGKVVEEFIVEHGSAITDIPEIPVKTGYTDTEPVWSSSDFSNITSDRIVTAIYTVNRYTVTFVADDKTVEEIIVAHGDAIGKVPQIPEKVGYHGNWDVTDFSNVTSDMTVKAVYEINKYTVTFKAGGKVVKEFVVEHGSSLSTIPNIPEKNGYTQTAPVWDITDFANITSNITVNAVYTPNVYKVTFVLEGATLGEVTVKHGESVTSFPEIPAKEGYHVVWDVNLKNVTSDMTANAAYEINKYTVTFKADGNIVKEFTIEHGGSITDIPKIPAKEGYTETAPVWDVTDFSNITADVTVNAVYTQDAVIEESQDTDTEDVDTEIDKDVATDDADTDDKGGFPIVPVVVGVAVVGGGIAVAVGTGAGGAAGAAGAAGATGHGVKAGRLFGKWRRRK